MNPGQKIREPGNDHPVVLTSGYSDMLAQRGVESFDVLQKPYSIEQLGKHPLCVAGRRTAWRRPASTGALPSKANLRRTERFLGLAATTISTMVGRPVGHPLGIRSGRYPNVDAMRGAHRGKSARSAQSRFRDRPSPARAATRFPSLFPLFPTGIFGLRPLLESFRLGLDGRGSLRMPALSLSACALSTASSDC